MFCQPQGHVEDCLHVHGRYASYWQISPCVLSGDIYLIPYLLVNTAESTCWKQPEPWGSPYATWDIQQSLPLFTLRLYDPTPGLWKFVFLHRARHLFVHAFSPKHAILTWRFSVVSLIIWLWCKPCSISPTVSLLGLKRLFRKSKSWTQPASVTI